MWFFFASYVARSYRLSIHYYLEKTGWSIFLPWHRVVQKLLYVCSSKTRVHHSKGMMTFYHKEVIWSFLTTDMLNSKTLFNSSDDLAYTKFPLFQQSIIKKVVWKTSKVVQFDRLYRLYKELFFIIRIWRMHFKNENRL